MKQRKDSEGESLSRVKVHWAGVPFAILLMAFILFYITALYSWTPLDASPFSVTIPPVSPKNYAGVYGAWISGVMIYYCGWLAWLIPFPMLLLSTRVMLSPPSFVSQAVGFLKGTLLFSGLFLFMVLILDMISPYSKMAGMLIPVAGAVGDAMSAAIETYLGSAGVILLLVTLPPWILFFSFSHEKRTQLFRKRNRV